ncbi:sodium- and chloride-dependent GABA transporter 2-like [Salminus brasiliensis]|uniref:sodium- and chloride-dependent GABA transporter 2-like n=1 Tax=Salminus brasiliensis TaxID=930266 RepID=UPI003B83A1FF
MVVAKAEWIMGEAERRTLAAAAQTSERGQWNNKVEFLLAMAGNIVGLGNVWRFPYLCYKNGGGKQLVPYIFFSLSLYVCTAVETMRFAYSFGIGHTGCLMALYSCICYNILLAWSLFYLISSLSSETQWNSCGNLWNTVNCVELPSNKINWTVSRTQMNFTVSAVTEFWERRVLAISAGIEVLGSVNWEILLCLLAAWIACYFCIWKGVKSTGKAEYFTAIFPYVMMLLLLLRSLTLPGALYGVQYYLYPQPSRLADPQVWIDAGMQIFFSYSLGAGSLTVLGSYNPYKNNCYRESIWLCVVNSCISVIAVFVVFSVLGFMAQQLEVDIENVAESGPGLAFIAYPQTVARMPLPQLWAACFFLMLVLLGLDTQFMSIEVVISSVSDMFPTALRKPKRREFFPLFFCTACFCFQILMTTQDELFLFFVLSSACLLFMGLFESLVIGWVFGADLMYDVIEDMCDKRPSAFFRFCWRYLTPLMCLGSFIFYMVRYQPLRYNRVYVYPDWAYVLGWFMNVSSLVLVLAWRLAKLFTHRGTLKQHFASLCTPDDKLPLTRKQRVELQMHEI